MTSLKDIQSLIADIDRIFPKADAHLPWSKPGDVALQRRVLERVRRYLVAQQQNFADAANLSLPQPSDRQESVQPIMQAVAREMDVLRAEFMQPLQADLEALRQQRESVVREIRMLEQKKQQMISEFSQELLDRCTNSLTQQLAQIVANFEASIATGEWTPDSMDAHSSPWPALEGHTDPITPVPSLQDRVGGGIHSPEQAEQLRSLQEQSDRMWATLDANQRTIFETLQRNLLSYQDSLSQGLEKMHSLGVQGELLFTMFLNRWLEQLGQNSSAPFSSASQPEAGTNQAIPATLLPNDTSTAINPNTLLHFPEQTSTGVDLSYPLSTDQPEAPPTIITPQFPQISTPNLPSPPEVQSDTSGSSPEESLLEDLNSADWEIVEGSDAESLDFDLGDNDAIDTFIQLDLNDTSLREPAQEVFGDDSIVPTPSPGDVFTPSNLNSQDLDFLLSWSDEPLSNASDSTTNTPIKSGEATELNNAEVADNPSVNTDHRYQEIDDFYQSLFGTEALSDTAKPERSDSPVEVESHVSESMQPSEELQLLGDNQPANTDAVTPLSPQVENVLFEEFAASQVIPPEHPATEEAISEQASGLSVEHSAVSWEVLLFEDSVPQSSNPADLDREAQLSLSEGGSLSDQESPQEQDSIEAIAALTDLFEEMGLSSTPSASEENSTPALTQQQPETSPANSEPEASWVDDTYIYASPDEDLLSLAALESELEEEIRLNQNVLQQLQHDLNSFENLKNQNAQRQGEHNLPSSNLEEPTLAPYTAPLDWHNQQYPPMPPQESLAEDWEEFILNSLRAQQDLPDASATTAPESVESDFDPDLFPQEALELDREHTTNAGAVIPDSHKDVLRGDRQEVDENSAQSEASGASEFAPSGELVEFEDEHFVEMQWDEPTESTSTEEITQPHESSPFAFPELEFELDFFSPEAVDSEPEGEVSAATPEGLSPQEQEHLSEPAQNTTLPLELSENNADTVPPQAQGDTGPSESQKTINPDSGSQTEQ